MKKIILIEDRPNRQIQAMGTDQVNRLQNIEELDIPSQDECKQIIEEANTGNKPAILVEYQLIIAHKSAFNAQAREFLQSFCHANKIDLIFFSGDFSPTSFKNDEHQLLWLDVKDLYTAQLIDFIVKYTQGQIQSLLELVYGDSWKLELLMQYQSLRTLYAQAQHHEEKFRIKDKMEMIEESLELDLDKTSLDSEIERLINTL